MTYGKNQTKMTVAT